MPNKPNIAISLGGSIVVPELIDVAYLKKFKALINNIKSQYNKIFIVVGGGRTARVYQAAANTVNPKLNNKDLDWVGIYVTRLNAEFLQRVFKELAHDEIIVNPTEKIKTNKKMLIGAGWLPGCSTDYDMVLMAQTYGIKEVLNLSNIEYVYDKDPKKYKDAKPQSAMTWVQVDKIVGDKWIPGANVPFDPKAIKLAKKLGLKVVTMKGTDLDNLKKYLKGKKFKGTVIS